MSSGYSYKEKVRVGGRQNVLNSRRASVQQGLEGVGWVLNVDLMALIPDWAARIAIVYS